MEKTYKIIAMMVIITLMMVTLATASLGNFKQGECVNIRTILNATAVSISSLSYPNGSVAITNKPMTQNSYTFNYTFCNTSTLGTYIYDYFDNQGNVYVNDFTITPTGFSPSISQSVTMFIIIAILLITIILFFLFGITTMNIPAKIFSLSISVILIVFTIGYTLNMANITVGEFTSLTSGFSPFYILFTVLLTAGAMGIILYLVTFIFKSFKNMRYGE